jgi:hypothetical protein
MSRVNLRDWAIEHARKLAGIDFGSEHQGFLLFTVCKYPPLM